MRKHRSLGEMISTATFIGCGLFILLHSMELLDNEENLRGVYRDCCWQFLYSGWVSLCHRKSGHKMAR